MRTAVWFSLCIKQMITSKTDTLLVHLTERFPSKAPFRNQPGSLSFVFNSVHTGETQTSNTLACSNGHPHAPGYVRVDRCIYKVRWQQVADQQQQGLDTFALHQPQVTHRRHGGPVGSQERYRAQDGGQSFRLGEKGWTSEKKNRHGMWLSGRSNGTRTATHQKE